MSRRSAGHAAAMRDRILEGAGRAFAAGGFRGTTVPRIATEAGVSVGLIYRYFPSKEELYLELCLTGSEITYTALAAQLATIPVPSDRLRAAFTAFMEAHADGTAMLVLQALPAVESDPRLREALHRRGEALRDFSAWFVRLGMERGEIVEDADVERLALAVSTLLDGALIAIAERGPDLDRAALVDAMVDLAMPALRASSAPVRS